MRTGTISNFIESHKAHPIAVADARRHFHFAIGVMVILLATVLVAVVATHFSLH